MVKSNARSSCAGMRSPQRLDLQQLGHVVEHVDVVTTRQLRLRRHCARAEPLHWWLDRNTADDSAKLLGDHDSRLVGDSAQDRSALPSPGRGLAHDLSLEHLGEERRAPLGATACTSIGRSI